MTGPFNNYQTGTQSNLLQGNTGGYQAPDLTPAVDPLDPAYGGPGNAPDPFSFDNQFPALPSNSSSSSAVTDPNAIPRKTDPISIIGNGFLDAIDMGQGMAAFGTAIAGRMIQPLYGKPVVTPEDFQAVPQIAKAVLDSYNQSYVQPIVQGRPQDLFAHAAQHPLNTYLDLMPFGKALQLGKLTGKAANYAASLPIASKAIQAAQQAGTSAKIIGNSIINEAKNVETLSGGINKIQSLGEEFKFRSDFAKGLDAATRNDLDILQSLWNKVPQAERASVMAAAEGTDPRLLSQGYSYLSGEAQAYLDQARVMMGLSTKWGKDLGQFTIDQAWRDRMLPSLELLKKIYGFTDEQLSQMAQFPEKLQGLLEDAQAYLAQAGVSPIYQGRLTEKAAAKALSNRYALPQFTLKGAAETARASVNATEGISNIKDPAKMAWAYQREALKRGDQFTNNSYLATATRFIETAQLQTAYQLLLKRLMDFAAHQYEMTPELAQQITKGNMITIETNQLFARIARNMPGFNDSEVATIVSKALPQQLLVPRAFADGIGRITAGKPGTLGKLWKGFANLARRHILGWNVSMPEWQQGQTIAMLALTQFVGPRDALVSFLSYALAFDKSVQKAIPSHIAGELTDALEQGIKAMHPSEALSAAQALPGQIAAGVNALKAQKPLQAAGAIAKQTAKSIWSIPDQTFARLTLYDYLTRVAAAGYYALKLSEKFPELGGPIKGMLTTTEAIGRIEAVMADSAAQLQVGQKVLKTLGDYSALQSQRRALLRSTFLWWNWYEHICKFAISLPETNPYKTSILSSIARVTPEIVQDPDIPDGLRQAGAVMIDAQNSQGIQYAVMKGSLNPFTSISEVAEMLVQPFAGNESSTVLAASNPLIPFMIAQAMRINPQTNRAFRDPRLLSKGGEQFRLDDVEEGRLIAQHPAPNIIEYFFRTIAPTPTRAIERFYEKATSGGEASQFTAPLAGESAPRTLYNSGGEVLDPGSYGEIMVQTITGIRAFPVDTSATQRMKMLDKQSVRLLLKQGMRQLRGRVAND